MNHQSVPRTGTPMLLAVCALSILILSLPVLGQERFGNLTGVATDPSGGVLPGVNVTVTNHATGRALRTTTRGDGTYTAAELEPGRYSVRFEKPGFARFEAPDVLVLVGKTLKVDASLQVGTLEQTVQVIEAAPLIDTSGTTIAHNVTAEEFDRIPKPRNFQGIVFTSPSVNTGAIEGGYQVNGASGAENNYYIDGVSTNSLIDGRARQDAVFEYLQEVQVKTGALEAEYGGALGGVISAVTKSGGNAFHGEVHYYLDGNRISAGPVNRLVLDPVNETDVRYVQEDKNKLDNHEVGGSLGGPFIKNKLFFFTSVSPRWQRASFDYLFSNGKDPDTIQRKRTFWNWFNKISFDPSNRIRTNFTWLFTPTKSEGSLYAYNGSLANYHVTSLASAQPNKIRGFFQPEQSYTGNVDFTLTDTSLLSVKGGRYYLNYKDTGIPATVPVEWYASSVGVPGVPPELQLPNRSSNTPRIEKSFYDITTRTYVQADFSKFLHFGGMHNFKLGVGTQKNVNSVNSSYGPLGFVRLYWGSSFRGAQGKYGYYEVHDLGTGGSGGAHITNMYIQDQWRVHSRLTLSLGLRTERETMPSFQRDVQDYAFRFNFQDKLAPRLGASLDLRGDGRIKLYGSWGRYYDWTKYELARGTFGGDFWRVRYRSLDTLDVYNLSLQNMPGQDLWGGALGYRDRRLPGFEYLDPDIRPMAQDMLNVGVEYEIRPKAVFAARYVHSNLLRTIEDLGVLDENNNELYFYANPGEGVAKIAAPSGATKPFPMPKAKRQYDAMELSLTRRFANRWFGSASYVYSRLYGNYAGLQSTDEIRPSTLGYGFGASQQSGADLFRGGGNANRYWDLDEAMWDSKGIVGLLGRLPTDRPHVLKLYGSYQMPFGTEFGGFFRVSSGTPITTQVTTINGIPVYVNGRGDLGRTPVFSQTDLMVSHEFSIAEGKRLRLEFNMMNLFNQKTAQFTFDRLNREDRPDSAGIDLHAVDLAQGFDYNALLAKSPDGQKAFDPRFKMGDLFNPGFAGRFLIKFIF